VPLGLVVQIGLAILVSSGRRLRDVLCVLFYLPVVIPTVVSILLIWRIGIAGPDGVIDRVYHLFAPDGSISWLDQQGRLILILFMLWSTAGLGMLVFLAGLQNVSRQLQEAAALDGATRGQILRTITVPLLTPVIFVVTFIAAAPGLGAALSWLLFLIMLLVTLLLFATGRFWVFYGSD
jgi:ABC-type sugar transport system permease subunit